MRDRAVSATERRFARDCVAAELRLDGRGLEQARPVNISLGPSFGFAQVSFSNTIAVASTTIDPITPTPDRPNEGTISIAVDFSPTCSETAANESMHRSGVSNTLTETRNCIEKFVRESRAIDTEALCILQGIKVWSVRVEIDVINDDGNCVDVCVAAVMASLMHARRPDVTVTGKEVRIHSPDEREPVPLPVHHVPLSVTFAVFGAGKPYEADSVVLDPVKKEEIASGGTLSFAFNSQGEVCGVYKAGGLPLDHTSFVKCTDIGEVRALQLTGILKKALADASAQHPLTTVRPMLVEPEPVAQIKNKEMLRSGRQNALKSDTVMSMWNATPVVDEAPPSRMDNEPVKMNENIQVDETVKSLFEKKDDTPEVIHVADASPDVTNIPSSVQLMQLDDDDDDDSSSGDDLTDAIIPAPKGKRRR